MYATIKHAHGSKKNKGNNKKKEECAMYDKDNTEQLRQELLTEVYAGAFAGMPAMLLSEDEIRSASPERLEEIARQFGKR